MSKEMEKKDKKIKKLEKNDIKKFSVDFFILLVGCACGSFSTVAVLIPNGLTTGGLTGMVRILQNFVPLDFSVIYYMLSIVIVIILLLALGIKEARKTLLLSVMYPTVLMIFEKFNFQLLEEKDILLAAVFCGVFSGISSGIIIWRGYSTSGTDAIAKIIRKKFMPEMSQGKIMVAIDACIIIISAFIFGRNIALYALITQAVISRTIDVVMFGFESKVVQIEIITKEKAEQILSYIMDDMQRGATTEKVIGEYTRERYTKIRVYCSPRESVVLKRELAVIDPTSFVSLIKVENVWAHGKGFKNINEDK